MTVREIDRQFEHWAREPSPARALIRLGARFGVAPPEPEGQHESFEPSSLEELRAMAASLGVTGAAPWEEQ